MKNKKSLIATFLFSLMMIIGISGCKKYPDNNGIDLTTTKSRLSHLWSVDNYKVNGVDLTSLVTSYTETFTSEGLYTYKWGIIEGAGTWAFQNGDKEILISGVTNQSNKTLYILKLQDMQFWYYFMDGSDKKEFHMIQK